MKQGFGKVIKMSSSRTHYVSIPALITSDDAYPFTPGEKIRVTVDGQRLIIEKCPADD
ncbi:hypothetical protein [Methanoplanus endosymbiosus]|uniref:Uncharacterized protein n=1 Tax=Methanoplanus endosymbiosus TaxID=33865 RepID=A0A9E7PSY0_9EURY|nr:hypothetical protein [Methanoplanus endosymbiosus]UUX93232.1 hypothetical protein L6E24_03665 [Methanoplanus endosymbiosus]